MRSPDWVRLPRLPVRSARVRIVGWLVGSVAVALGASILVTHLIGLEQLNERVDRSLTQEVAEFRTLAEQGIDPVTASRSPTYAPCCGPASSATSSTATRPSSRSSTAPRTPVAPRSRP